MSTLGESPQMAEKRKKGKVNERYGKRILRRLQGKYVFEGDT